MGKKKSSSRAWLKEHHDDVYVQRAQKEGYRSRAVYKLMEINNKDQNQVGYLSLYLPSLNCSGNGVYSHLTIFSNN